MSMMLRRGLAKAAAKQTKAAPVVDAPKREEATSAKADGAAMQKRQNSKGRRG